MCFRIFLVIMVRIILRDDLKFQVAATVTIICNMTFSIQADLKNQILIHVASIGLSLHT